MSHETQLGCELQKLSVCDCCMEVIGLEFPRREEIVSVKGFFRGRVK